MFIRYFLTARLRQTLILRYASIGLKALSDCRLISAQTVPWHESAADLVLVPN